MASGANPFDAPYANPFASTPRQQPASSSAASTSSAYFPAGPPPPSNTSFQPNYPALGAAAATYAAASSPPQQASWGGRTEPNQTRGREVMEVAGSAPGPSARPQATEALKEDSELLPWWAKLALPICPQKRFKVKVKLHAAFIVYWAIMCANGFASSAEKGVVSLIVIGPVLFVSVLAHELAHAFMARMMGHQVISIVLSPFGGMTYCAHVPHAKTDILIALAGPLAHVPLGVIFYFLTDSSAGDWWRIDESGAGILEDTNVWSLFCYSTLVVQVTLFFLNLLVPCFPLDAGRIVVDLCAVAGYERESSAKVCSAISAVTGLGIFAFGVVYSIKLLTLNSTVLIGFWAMWQAWGMFRYVKRGKIEEHPMFANYYAGPNSDGTRV